MSGSITGLTGGPAGCTRPRGARAAVVWDRVRVAPDDPRQDGSGPPVAQAPDDARDLFRDVAALHRERRAARRRDRWRRWLGLGGGRGAGPGAPPRLVSGRIVVAVLLVVAGVASLPVLLQPGTPATPPSRPLASPVTPPGEVGGLLPEAALSTPGGDTTTRQLPRPGALLLAPVPCEGPCQVAVSEAVSQLRQATRALRVVTPRAADPEARVSDALRVGPARGLATSGVDVDGVLARAYRATGLTVVTTGPDGVVLDVTRDVVPGRRLDQEVARLLDSSS